MPAISEDTKLVSRAVAGSDAAWQKLVKKYERRVYNYALRMVGHADDAFDLMQEVFMGVYKNLSGFRGDSPFAGWLFRIASYRCTDYLRRRRFHDTFDEESFSGSVIIPEAKFEPESQVFSTHANEQICAVMALLPSEQRQVVELKFFQHFTFDEIGGQLGISPNTAKTRLYSALAKMKAHEELKDAM